jgi:hypothetical protein
MWNRPSPGCPCSRLCWNWQSLRVLVLSHRPLPENALEGTTYSQAAQACHNWRKTPASTQIWNRSCAVEWAHSSV